MITLNEIKIQSAELYPAVILDKLVPYRSRKMIRKLTFYSMIFILACMIFVGRIVTTANVDNLFMIRGAFFLVAILWVNMYVIEWFYLSFYTRDYFIDFEVAYLAITSDPKDLTKSFLKTEIGEMIMRRLGISAIAVKSFLEKSNRHKLSENDVKFLETRADSVPIVYYMNSIYDYDESFSDFLSANFVDERMFLESADWSDDILYEQRNDRLTFSRENLENIPSIGKNWSYHNTNILKRYCHEIIDSPIYKSLGQEWRMYMHEAEKIENLLGQKDGQNIMIVVPYIDAGMEIISALGKMIVNGNVAYKVESKKIWVVDYNKFKPDTISKADFEITLNNILVEAHNAGNIILIFPKFSNFTERAYNFEIDVDKIFREFLKSSDINIVALAEEREFRESIETHFDLMKSFTQISLREVNLHTIDRILKREMLEIEKERKVFFTYQSLRKTRHLYEGEPLVGSVIRQIALFLNRVATSAIVSNNRIITEKTIQNELK